MECGGPGLDHVERQAGLCSQLVEVCRVSSTEGSGILSQYLVVRLQRTDAVLVPARERRKASLCSVYFGQELPRWDAKRGFP